MPGRNWRLVLRIGCGWQRVAALPLWPAQRALNRSAAVAKATTVIVTRHYAGFLAPAGPCVLDTALLFRGCPSFVTRLFEKLAVQFYRIAYVSSYFSSELFHSHRPPSRLPDRNLIGHMNRLARR